MSRRSRGFTLIELLVVVAILGILAAVGIVAYNGYVTTAKINSVKNALQQAALGQTEYYTDNGTYYPQTAVTSPCTADSSSTTAVETNLLGGAKVIIDASKTPKEATAGYYICVSDHASNFQVIALDADNSAGCTISLTADSALKRDPKKC